MGQGGRGGDLFGENIFIIRISANDFFLENREKADFQKLLKMK